MAKQSRRLGRGLSSLVSPIVEPEAPPSPARQSRSSDERPAVPVRPQTEPAPSSSIAARMVPADQLTPNPFQPRSEVDQSDIQSLADSIKRSGMLQPISARLHDGTLQIIAGERRWWAAKQIGMSNIPVIIRDATDEEMVELALIENIQREDLNAIDRAQAYRAFCARFNLKADQVAERIGEDRSTVANYLRLLELPGPIRELVAAGDVSMGHARCLLGVPDEQKRWQLAEAVVRNELSVRALEEIVRREKTRDRDPGAPATAGRPARSPHLKDLERRFEQAVHTKVTIKEGRKKGTGRITIDYYSLDDFDRIAGRLGVSDE